LWFSGNYQDTPRTLYYVGTCHKDQYCAPYDTCLMDSRLQICCYWWPRRSGTASHWSARRDNVQSVWCRWEKDDKIVFSVKTGKAEKHNELLRITKKFLWNLITFYFVYSNAKKVRFWPGNWT
jgi:hypothetical protein